MVVITDAAKADAVTDAFAAAGERCVRLGRTVSREHGRPQVITAAALSLD
jgi:hypothetical protein